jgi:tetratricopeptide (TPR) repeat protein
MEPNNIEKQINIQQEGEGNTQKNYFSSNLQHLEGNPFQPPQIRQGGLFGREEKLAELHELLQGGKNVCVVAGMGGVGKTELVRQYAHHQKCQSHFTGGVFYIDARNRQDIAAEIVALTKWKFMRDLSPDLSPQQMVSVCWESWKGQTKNVLLILDDIVGLDRVKSYLPPEKLNNLRLLLTSRETPDKRIAEKLDLETLLAPAGLDLLSSIINSVRVESEREQAELLCQDLGYLPLALELVGYYLDEDDYQDLSLAAMRVKLQAKVKHPSLSPEQLPIGMSALRGVQAAFDLSWDELKPEAQDLACILGAFASAPIRWDFIIGIYGHLQIEMSNPDDLKDRWLKSLRKLHLVIDFTADTYDLHPLIRDYLGEKLKQHSKYSEIKQAFCNLFSDIANNVEQATDLITFNSIELHLKKMLGWLDGIENTQIAFSLCGLATLYLDQGRHNEAEPLYLRSLEIAELHFGKNHVEVGGIVNRLALLYKLQGHYYKAELLYLRSIEIIESQLDKNHIDVVMSFYNLAELYESQGRYSEAESLYLRSLEIAEIQLGEDHLKVSSILNGLAKLYAEQGRRSEAEPLQLRSLEIRENTLDKDNLLVAVSLTNLSILYIEQHRYNEAETHLVRALEIRESKLRIDHPDLSYTLSALAMLYESQNRCGEVEPLYLRSLQIKESQLGINHPDVATILTHLAGFYDKQGKYSEAESLYLRSLKIRETQLGIDHPDVTYSLYGLAKFYDSQCQYVKAESLYLRSIEVGESKLGINHHQVESSIDRLAELYKFQKRHAEAESLFLRLLKIRKTRLDVDPLSIAHTLSNLAMIYADQCKYVKAQEFEKQALVLLRKNSSNSHAEIQIIVLNIKFLRVQHILNLNRDKLNSVVQDFAHNSGFSILSPKTAIIILDDMLEMLGSNTNNEKC